MSRWIKWSWLNESKKKRCNLHRCAICSEKTIKLELVVNGTFRLKKGIIRFARSITGILQKRSPFCKTKCEEFSQKRLISITRCLTKCWWIFHGSLRNTLRHIFARRYSFTFDHKLNEKNTEKQKKISKNKNLLYQRSTDKANRLVNV